MRLVSISLSLALLVSCGWVSTARHNKNLDELGLTGTDTSVDTSDDTSTDDTGPTSDADGDGFVSVDAGGDDCDDSDAAINPDAEEVCVDGIDQDCDGSPHCVLASGMDESAGVRFEGPGEGDRWGVVRVADLDGDLTNDLILGSAAGSPGANQRVGHVVWIRGPFDHASGGVLTDAAYGGLTGDLADQALELLEVGDVDLDGQVDLILADEGEGGRQTVMIPNGAMGEGENPLDRKQGARFDFAATQALMLDWGGDGKRLVLTDGRFLWVGLEGTDFNEDSPDFPHYNLSFSGGDDILSLVEGPVSPQLHRLLWVVHEAADGTVYRSLVDLSEVSVAGTMEDVIQGTFDVQVTPFSPTDIDGVDGPDSPFGAPAFSVGGSDEGSGAVFFLSGPFAGIDITDTTNTPVLYGGKPQQGLGSNVAGVGDVNGDGDFDHVVCAQSNAAFLLTEAIGDGTTNVELAGAGLSHSEGLGADWCDSVLPAGDVDGDTYDDFVLSAPGALNGKGQLVLYFGAPEASE